LKYSPHGQSWQIRKDLKQLLAGYAQEKVNNPSSEIAPLFSGGMCLEWTRRALAARNRSRLGAPGQSAFATGESEIKIHSRVPAIAKADDLYRAVFVDSSSFDPKALARKWKAAFPTLFRCREPTFDGIDIAPHEPYVSPGPFPLDPRKLWDEYMTPKIVTVPGGHVGLFEFRRDHHSRTAVRVTSFYRGLDGRSICYFDPRIGEYCFPDITAPFALNRFVSFFLELWHHQYWSAEFNAARLIHFGSVDGREKGKTLTALVGAIRSFR
jgi:hypothetical protein